MNLVIYNEHHARRLLEAKKNVELDDLNIFPIKHQVSLIALLRLNSNPAKAFIKISKKESENQNLPEKFKPRVRAHVTVSFYLIGLQIKNNLIFCLSLNNNNFTIFFFRKDMWRPRITYSLILKAHL